MMAAIMPAKGQDIYNNGGCDGDGIIVTQPDTASLTLVKQLAGDPAPNTVDDWLLEADGTDHIGPAVTGNSAITNATVEVGTYTMAEDGPTQGYTSSDWVCNDDGQTMTVTNGNTVEITANQEVTCTITNTYDDGGGNTNPDVTVTIVKYIDGEVANANNANGEAFPMTATWEAANIGNGTGNYSLSTAGFNNPNPYYATTSAMTSGANYTTNENVDMTCETEDEFALVGYSTGSTLEAAAAAQVSTTAPQLTNITTNQFIVVHNHDCSTAPTYSISGMIYHDNNPENGALDEGEDGLEGWRAYVDLPIGEGEGNNEFDPEEPNALSDANGNYTITGLEPGCYTVREVLESGWNETQPTEPQEYEYKNVSVGFRVCSTDSLLDKVTSLFVKTANAAVSGNATGLNFGNVEQDNGGGGSSGGGSRRNNDDSGRVLGDTTSIPYIAPQVLGATTLPVTGSSLNYLWAMLAILGMIALPAAISRKMRIE